MCPWQAVLVGVGCSWGVACLCKFRQDACIFILGGKARAKDSPQECRASPFAQEGPPCLAWAATVGQPCSVDGSLTPQLCSRQGRGPFSVKEYVCEVVLLYWVPHRCMPPPPGDLVWQYVVLPLLPIYWYLPLYQTLSFLSGLRRGV